MKRADTRDLTIMHHTADLNEERIIKAVTDAHGCGNKCEVNKKAPAETSVKI
jgi:hypothetical protein